MRDKLPKFITNLVTISFILTAVIGCSITVFKHFRDERREEEQRMKNSIIAEYKLFREDVKSINLEADSFTEKLGNILSYDVNLSKNGAVLQDLFAEFEDFIDENTKKYEILHTYCPGNKYESATIIAGCKSYLMTSETLHNSYLKNIENTNERIKTFNQMNKDDNRKYSDIEEIVSQNYTEYVDYDKDGEYSGK